MFSAGESTGGFLQTLSQLSIQDDGVQMQDETTSIKQEDPQPQAGMLICYIVCGIVLI